MSPYQDPFEGENGVKSKCTIGIGKGEWIQSNLLKKNKLVHSLDHQQLKG